MKKSIVVLILVCLVTMLLVLVTVAQEADAYVPGTDITEQLRSDLDAGLDVRLPAGHYYVSQSIIVQYYSGTVSGAGKGKTIIEAAQGFQDTPDPLFPPEYTVAEMFALYWPTGDVAFRDMTLLVTGDAPAQLHNNPFKGYTTTIDNAIVVAAVSPDAENVVTITYANIEVKGENSSDPGSYNGKNLVYPLIVAGYPATGSVNAVIKNCEIENSGEYAIDYFQVSEGSGQFKDNKVANTYGAIWLGWGLELADVTVKGNQFTNLTVDPIQRDFPILSYCEKDNTLDGALMTNDCPG